MVAVYVFTNTKSSRIDNFQAGEFYSINYEIEAAMKAERIDLHSSNENNQGDNTPFSEYGTNPEDQFRSGPLDYTL